MDQIDRDIIRWNEDFRKLEEDCKTGFYAMRGPIFDARVEDLDNRMKDIMNRLDIEVEANIRALDAQATQSLYWAMP